MHTFVIVKLLVLKLVSVEVSRGELKLLSFELPDEHPIVLSQDVVQVNLRAQALPSIHHVVAIEELLILELLVHRKVLHPRCLIDEVDVRLLLLLSIIINIRFSLQWHAICLSLQLLVHLFEGRSLR